MSFLAEIQKELSQVKDKLSSEEQTLVHWASSLADDLWNALVKLEKEGATEITNAKLHLEELVTSLKKHLHL